MEDIDIFVPSYHRAKNIKTMKYLVGEGYTPEKIHIVIDSEADDRADYELEVIGAGCKLHVFDMSEARRRYDYVHRAPTSRRSAGQARNMFYDIASEEGIKFYIIIDDDTHVFQIRAFNKYVRKANIEEIRRVFAGVKEMMTRRHIGVFGLSQTGEMLERLDNRLFRKKVMNTTFVNTAYVYRGERGVQDDDTSFFLGMMNEGLFTGSLRSGLVLNQTVSATAKGGLTDLYNEQKLLNKALICPIQFPSAVWGEKQKMNGNRVHHRVDYRYIFPMVMKGERDNIAWDTYPEDIPFTNEPKRNYDLQR